ncbi:hypothetical protein E8E14_003083 [Neopestalotiopsis sp. 37M]|nr:hypothetical protein E8E14_003083 [Neopestalotiopsis sp. 37M]
MSMYEQQSLDEETAPEMATSSCDLDGNEQQGNEIEVATPMFFTRFSELPTELRSMILRERLNKELIPPLRTLTMAAPQDSSSSEPLEPHVLTSGTPWEDRGLWYTGNALIRADVERHCCRPSSLLPVRRLTDPGSQEYCINEGVTRSTPERHHAIGRRPLPRGTVFYAGPEVVSMISEESLLVPCDDEVDGNISSAPAPAARPRRLLSSIDWLENLLLSHQTFRALIRHAERTGSDRPFGFAPNLRTLYLGFGRRWAEVVMLEAQSAADALVPVRLLQQSSSSGSSSRVADASAPIGLVMLAMGDTPGSEGRMHVGLTAMIMDAAKQSLSDVRALEALGLQVRWVVVPETAMVRPKESISGFVDYV